MKYYVLAILGLAAIVGYTEESTTAAGAKQKSYYDRTDAEMGPMIRSAEGGSLQSAYYLCRFYARNQNQQKEKEWIAKTRQLASQAPTNDPLASRIVQVLDHLEKNAAGQTNALPVDSAVSGHQHSASCSHSQKPSGAQRKSFYDWTEAELEPVISAAEGGNLNSAYMLSRYYAQKQDQQKAEQWIAKTRQLAAQAPTNDPLASKIVQKLDRSGQHPASQTKAPSTNFSVPRKNKAPRIQP